MIIVADAMELPLADASVQCVVTSPPYYGLRKYAGEQTFVWEHDDGTTWTGALGHEPTPEMYVEHLVQVFQEVKRVLKDDGTLWLNLGDSYSSGGRGNYDTKSTNKGNGASRGLGRPTPAGYKAKELIGIPWLVAFALRADGWYLRAENIWHKPNAMPESVRDRTTRAHEQVFMLTKAERYVYNADAIKTPYAEATIPRRLKGIGETYTGQATKDYANAAAQDPSETKRRVLKSIAEGKGANARSVWRISTQPFRGAHFATFPTALVERCVKAGSHIGDVVLDPFGGSGTVAVVAQKLGRRGVACDIALEYARLGRLRLAGRERDCRGG